jgi:hypothetical protein
MAEVEIRPFVEEAISSLGFVRPECADWLAEAIVEHANRNHGRSIRESGTRLSIDSRTALGLPRYGDGHLSTEVWEALTELGRQEPVGNFDDTVSRALTNARDAVQKIGDLRFLQKGAFAGVKIGPAPGIGLCVAGMTMVGRTLPEPPDLPFRGCDRRYCSCSWRMVTKWELEQGGG